MSLIEKYHRGQTALVYEEIASMGAAAFERRNMPDVRAVLAETMNRVAFNLEVIYTALREINYCFKEKPYYDFEYPILKPGWRSQFQIRRMEKAVRPFGYIPLSLKTFSSIVGSSNFAWDYDANPDIPWKDADPIQIGPVADLLDEAKQLEKGDDGWPIGLLVAADHYHKDNISGGPAYRVELTTSPQIDSRFLNGEHNTTFIDYLRITFENCGFSRAYEVSDLPDFAAYCKKVRPLLKLI